MVNQKIYAVIMLILLSISPTACSRENTGKPNIIYIFADDAGYGALSCYGQKKYKTPNLDRLADEGIKFLQYYSGSTVCAPSRCTLLTGYHTGHCEIRRNVNSMKAPLSAEAITIAEKLKEAGYTTGAFGKWAMGYSGNSGDPLNQGFDEFFGYLSQVAAHNHYPKSLWHNQRVIKLDGKTYSHDLIVEKALAFIRKNKDTPFFCYLPVLIPHAAMQVPKSYHDVWRKKYPQFDDTVGKYRGTIVQNPVAAFPAMMTKLDDSVGQIFDLVRELGIDDNTIIMYSSDNGPHKEGGHRPKFWNSNGPFRGIKRDLYEGGIRNAFLARWPKKIKAGVTTNHISASWDIMPTFCELAGIDPPDNIDGISFVPTLLGEGIQKPHEYLYWEFHGHGGTRAVRMGDWKGIQRKVRWNPDGPILLYDLKTDLLEKINLADKHPKIAKNLRSVMDQAHTPLDVIKSKLKKETKANSK